MKVFDKLLLLKKGGQTVYYLTSGNAKVTAFQPGFRMTVGDPTFRTAQQLQAKYKYM